MAMLIHRCKCGHVDHFHNHRGECSFGLCGTRCKSPQLSETPEIIPSFQWDGRQSVLVETISEPGVKTGSSSHPIVPCGCDRCREIYDGEAAA